MVSAVLVIEPIGEVGAVLVNGWLLGREYFELVALRHMSPRAADALRRRHGSAIRAADARQVEAAPQLADQIGLVNDGVLGEHS